MNFWKKINNFFGSKSFKELVLAINLLGFMMIVWSIYWQMQSDKPDPITVMVMLIVAVIVFLFISVME